MSLIMEEMHSLAAQQALKPAEDETVDVINISGHTVYVVFDENYLFKRIVMRVYGRGNRGIVHIPRYVQLLYWYAHINYPYITRPLIQLEIVTDDTRGFQTILWGFHRWGSDLPFELQFKYPPVIGNDAHEIDIDVVRVCMNIEKLSKGELPTEELCDYTLKSKPISH